MWMGSVTGKRMSRLFVAFMLAIVVILLLLIAFLTLRGALSTEAMLQWVPSQRLA